MKFPVIFCRLKMISQKNEERAKYPKTNANFLSNITFLYSLRTIWNTFKTGKFEEHQLPDIPKTYKAEVSGLSLQNHLQTYKNNNKQISLSKILLRCYGMNYLLLGLMQLIVRSAVIVTIPMALGKVILYFQPNQKELSKNQAIFYASLLILLNFCNVTYLHNYLLKLSEFGIKIRTSICSVLFRKCLKLPVSALSDLTTGRIVNLMTKDVAAVEKFIFYFNDTLIGIAQAVIVFGLLFVRMGLSAFVGMGILCVTIPLQICTAKITSKLRLKSNEKTDARLQVTKETLSGIGSIKMNNWEDIFEEKINTHRSKEMKAILKISIYKILTFLLSNLSSKIAFCSLLISYLLLGNAFSAELIYYITTLFMRIRHALNIAIPTGVLVTAEVRPAIERLEGLLKSKEIPLIDQLENNTNTIQIQLTNCSVRINDKQILKDVNLNISSGLVTLTGPVGSGKTTLLKTIMGEYELDGGKLVKEGVISYAPQEPWIFPGTLSENIIFEEEFDEDRYKKILEICALDFDLKRTPLNKLRNIGDKGANISKGQKARINLARALYKRADIYLLDDPLASLDTLVQRFVFINSVQRFLSNKTCLFVTHNLELVRTGAVVHMKDHEIVEVENRRDEEECPVPRIEDVNKINVDKNGNAELTINDEGLAESSKLLIPLSDNKNVYREKNKSGKVDIDVYKKYIHSGGGLMIISLFMILFFGTHFSKSYSEKILSDWVDTIHNNSTQQVIRPLENKQLLLYFIFVISTTILALLSGLTVFRFSKKTSLKLHVDMIKSVLNASMKFFDRNLLGNILNRFSKDLNIVDEEIPFALYEFLEIFFGMAGIVILLSSVNIIFLLPTIGNFFVLYLLRKVYIPAGRSLQRLDTATKSPVVGFLNSSLEGLTTIRAFGAQSTLTEAFDRHQNLNVSASLMSKICDRAFGYYLDVSCTIFIGAIIGTFIFFDLGSSVGDVGLAITQAFMLTGVVQYGLRKWTEIENKMTSAERILQYTDLEQDLSYAKSPCTWPDEATIKFQNVSFKYNEDYVLRDINLEIGTKQKVGIIGRTGAGKSTLISLLLGLYPYEGDIFIGPSNLTNIPRKILRRNISIISQDPVLFTGTIRANLDPCNKHTDEQIWSVIRKLQLEKLIESLYSPISESGSNFSAGQKQLLCLVRCLLGENKTIILDEATSDVDLPSECLINCILQQNFEECTLILVAHRLKTVMNCDVIVVVQEGRIVEKGKPEELKLNTSGVFYQMIGKST
ncbi:unnamed protein product [Phyllotreta striolata]|uniref:Uncharacterized protein n=1 Tax=Phyllotreta striolata TaxID=444603 RepID=A0A9N9XMN7_PHYSR|nr:unnamed protein product [Phyllotreta striolata]